MDEFLVRALLAALGVAAVAGPLGSFLVWRRMAYFGDTLSHSALLGVTLGFLLGIDPTIGIIGICAAVALLLALGQRQSALASDTLLGILSHGALSLGLVSLAFMETLRVDLIGYLLGDVLSVTWNDITVVYIGGAVVLGILAWLWRPLLAITVHEDLARVEGVPVPQVQIAFMMIIAVTIAIAMKVVGILLITSLLIIPAAAARAVSKTPEQMALVASLVGMLAVLGGLAGSFQWDLPSGPAIVTAAALLFALSLIGRRLAGNGAG
ncbi:MAG: zinc ABC transporter permease subunit ZnuB [Alphaproteobacteria bacterium]|nr:zinc ABC transporter permease subunit ZnuB [Alphaproteobacteria bacterium]